MSAMSTTFGAKPSLAGGFARLAGQRLGVARFVPNRMVSGARLAGGAAGVAA